jgi:hypothetical protein
MEFSIFAGELEDYFPPVKPPVSEPARPQYSGNPVERVIYVTRGGLAVVAYLNRKGKEVRYV